MADLLLDIDEKLLRERIDAVVRRTMAMDMVWDWPRAVAFYGVSRAWETTGEKAYLDFMAKWVDEYLELGLPPFMVNSVAMGTASSLSTGGQARKSTWTSRWPKPSICGRTRSASGRASSSTPYRRRTTFQVRPGRTRSSWPPIFCSAWAVSWTRKATWTTRSNSTTGTRSCSRIRRRTSSTTGMTKGRRATCRVSSGRGQRLGFADHGRGPASHRLSLSHVHADRGALRDQLSLWYGFRIPRSLAHDPGRPSSYLETSASAGFGTALIVNGNPLHRKAAKLALDGVLSKIADDGSVLDVSAAPR